MTIVAMIPIGSTPGWNNRPSAPTIAPTMMSQIQCMVRGVPRSERVNPRLRTT